MTYEQAVEQMIALVPEVKSSPLTFHDYSADDVICLDAIKYQLLELRRLPYDEARNPHSGKAICPIEIKFR
jgi:hypothetical protein